MSKTESKNDFSKGSVAKNIISLALPMTIAQLVNLLYNIVDRMYIGRIGEEATLALTGLGLTFPIITMVSAFANLFGMGGAPLCSIARGKGNLKRAEKIIGNSFTMLLIFGVLLAVVGILIKKPVLYLFGASDLTYPYADQYLVIYLLGTVFVMIGLGMNSFINAQGFGKIGMTTVILGAIINIVLDPILIFVFQLGVRGAAIATVISQMAAAVWILKFLTGKKALLKIKLINMKPDFRLIREITALGLSGFVMAVTNSLVQVVCNATLQSFGGDLYVGIMTVLNSVREIFNMPITGITNGGQPVISFNYGAGKYDRVRKGIRFMSGSCIAFMAAAWLVLFLFPEPFIRIFNSDPQLIQQAIPAMRIYFFGFFMMALQFSGQFTFTALGMSKYAVFFSLLRKAIIVVPLTILLPRIAGLGVMGVFLAEPVSNFIGGTAAFSTMLVVVGRELRKRENEQQVN